jgi:hypothetical protein
MVAVKLLSGSYTHRDSKGTGYKTGDDTDDENEHKERRQDKSHLMSQRRASLSTKHRHNGTNSITIRVKNNGKTLMSLLHIVGVGRTTAGGNMWGFRAQKGIQGRRYQKETGVIL